MNRILLATVQKSVLSDVLLWGLAVVLALVLVWLIFYQRRQKKNLVYELDQLSQLKENDIQTEFVLRAMHLSTWHVNSKDHTIVFDADFREKTGAWQSQNASFSLSESAPRIHPLDAERVEKAFESICSGAMDSYHEQYRILDSRTKKYYWEESYATIAERDVEGKPIKIVGTSMRIDDRKTMEQALIEARNRAEESDRLKSAFIANMSHEIRTPLNAIIGFTSVLPDVSSPEERQSLLDLIHENTQKLLRIIDDVVNISKIESGKDEVVLTNFDLNQTLTDLADRYRSELKPGVELNTMFASAQLSITTDYNRFCEIVKHLLSNATKFTDQGHIVVGYDAPAEGRLRFWVRDTGRGIAEENLERVFERFFKVDEFIPGAGLGLSTCRTMAYSLGGNVLVDSKLGEGSTFVLEIPVQ